MIPFYSFVQKFAEDVQLGSLPASAVGTLQEAPDIFSCSVGKLKKTVVVTKVAIKVLKLRLSNINIECNLLASGPHAKRVAVGG